MNEPPENKKIKVLALALIALTALLLRFLLLGHKCFWSDEGVTWFIALSEIHSDAHPPFYFYIVNYAVKLFGWSEVAGRLPSVVFGWVSILVVYKMGKSFFDEKFGLYAAFITGISAFLIPVSQEMRMYSLFGLETLLTLWFFLVIIRDDKVHLGWWIGLFLTSLAALYTQSLFAFVLLFFGLVIVIQSFGKSKKKLLYFLIFSAALAILFLPQLIDILSKAAVRRYVYATDLWHFKLNVYRVVLSYFSFMFGNFLTNLPGSIIPFLRSHPFHLTAAISMVCLWFILVFSGSKEFLKIAAGKGSPALTARIMLGLMVFSTLMFMIISVSTARQMMFIYIPFIFMLTSFFRTFKKAVFARVMLLAFVSLTTISLVNYYKSPYFAYERQDWRKAGAILENNLKPDDAIYFVSIRNIYYTVKFYRPDLNNQVYYRVKLDDPDIKPEHHKIEWGSDKIPQDWIKELMKKYPRLWVFWLKQSRESGEDLSEYFNITTYDFGQIFQLHLFENKTDDDR